MPKAYWVICHRSTKSPEKFAAFTKLAYPAIHAAGIEAPRQAAAQQQHRLLRLGHKPSLSDCSEPNREAAPDCRRISRKAARFG